MKLFNKFLLVVFCLMPVVATGQVATTAGSNLTAWNGDSGATNNNTWNQMMNSRTMATAPVGKPATADFGNCNSLILRCATPKCAGCTTMDIARPIVAGCVNSESACKKYGDDLVEFISAQMVSNATNKAQQAEIAAQNAAAQAAAAQNNMQMQQMQQQMAQMQQQMQQQNAQQMAQMQAALDEQKAMTAAAIADATAAQQAVATAPTAVTTITDEQTAAAESGVSADLLARQQISGQILSKIENAEVLLKKLNATMQEAFSYAGCDTRGGNCRGPKRVKVFKQKAQQFFQPYDDIVDEAYEGLEMALAVGVDVSDVIMMLSGACNQWGKFLCTGVKTNKGVHSVDYYTSENCVGGRSKKLGFIKGGMECSVNMAIPPQDDTRCTLTELITDGDEAVLREWISENEEDDKLVRVGCATAALESIAIFGRRSSRSGATLDLDTLERILAQDAPDYVGTNRFSSGTDNDYARIKYCGLTERGYQNLLNAVQTKKLPPKICVPYKSLENTAMYGGVIGLMAGTGLSADLSVVPGVDNEKQCDNVANGYAGACAVSGTKGAVWDNNTRQCKLQNGCVFDEDKGILTKSQAEVEKKAQSSYNALNSSVASSMGGGIAECSGFGMEWKQGMFGAYSCFCGDKIIDTKTQKCVPVHGLQGTTYKIEQK